ncbi:MAG: 50S ribosomal protein L24 [archaeon]
MAFATSWKASNRPRKQRNYRNNAPLHIRGSFLHAPLSKDLKKKYKKNAVRVRREDKVKIIKGTYAGKEGKIERINTKRGLLYLTKVDVQKKDGSKALVPLRPASVVITELYLDDKKRAQRFKV